MKTILILDDEQAARESFSDYFEDHLWNPVQKRGSPIKGVVKTKNTSPSKKM